MSGPGSDVYHNPRTGSRLCRHCRRDKTNLGPSVSERIIDLLETYYGRWFTMDNITDLLEDRHHPDSVRRALRELRQDGTSGIEERERPDPGIVFGERSSPPLQFRIRERAYLEATG